MRWLMNYRPEADPETMPPPSPERFMRLRSPRGSGQRPALKIMSAAMALMFATVIIVQVGC